jgi:hydrogenase maturation protease
VTRVATQRGALGNVGRAGVLWRVVGCGNAQAGDDSVGLEIVRRLRERGDCACELLERPQAGLELMDVLRDTGRVLFIDAVSSGAAPGTLHLVPLPSASVVPRALNAISSHGWGLVETLRLMAALHYRLPRLALLGVEIESVQPGAARSAAVESGVQMVVECFEALETFLTLEGKWDWGTPRRFAPGEAPTGKGGF